MRHFDTVVIGAGNAGLASAAALQRGGSKTLLLERHNIPGGCATSFVRGEFEFEVALHQLSGLGTEERPFIMRKIFDQLGVMDKVEFVQEHSLYRMIVPGEIDVSLPASWSGLRYTLQDMFPEESEAIASFLQLCEKITIEAYVGLPQARKMKSETLLKAQCPHFVKYGFKSVQVVLDEFFRNDKLKHILSPYWTYGGVPPSIMQFPDLAQMIYAYAAFKPWHIKGGSQAMSNALLESFLEAGGTVHFNCGAEKILTSGGRVHAVRLESGETVTCEAVVSNASPILTFNELLDIETPPATVHKDFKSRRMGTSAFVIYMGLDCTPEELGITDASSFIYESLDEDAIFERMSTLESPLGGMLTCYNLEDADFAPKGKSQVVLVCLQYGEKWKSVPPEQYAKTKYAFAEKLIDLVAKVYPKIRDHIEEVEVATPLTMMRYLNTPDGAIYGFQQTPQDSNLMRERLDAVPGLYMAGSWTSVGGFQPTYMAGEATARAVLKKLKTEEVAYA
ncbi:MAG: NAD(P)/FAD-dependent oxidoreductase [Pseudomonadales bacterium]|nr:NAD(P)/FAD-dependent oxidoreductase [Pseudomonadales bacterium]